MREEDLKILIEIMNVINNDHIIQELIERYLDFNKVRSYSYAWNSFGITKDKIEAILDELDNSQRDRLNVPIMPELRILRE